jgi:pyruvate/2-oxoglutarate dehydrogenase complex dihydrolipoamide dehydrogenase (E3) component
MAELVKPEFCVIGAGPGGLSVAAAAAAFGAPVILVEQGDMGADTLRRAGSVPSKALVEAAAQTHALRDAARFGVKARFTTDFTAIRAHLRSVVDAVGQNSTRARLTGLGVRVVKGTARFADAATVAVDDISIKANRFVIATGSSPLLPAIPGLLETPHFTTETVFDLPEVPRHLIVIGAGAVGLELAQSFRRLGAAVTVLDAAAPLAGADRECATIVLDALAREGVAIRGGVEIAKVARSLAKVHVVVTTQDGVETIEGSHLLVAAGRRPNIEHLDLDAAGIRYRPDGIVVDQRLMTTNKRVFAVGDVIGAPHFAHLAQYQAALVIRRTLFRLRVGVDERPVPRVVFTDPELAQVGLSEDEARRLDNGIRILRWPYRESDRAQIDRATEGHIKVVTDRKGAVLGATIVGRNATENITAWTLAISQNIDIRALAGLVVPYPTYAEVGKRAAVTYLTHGLTNPRARRIMGWLRR